MDLETAVIYEPVCDIPKKIYRDFLVETGVSVALDDKLKKCDTNILVLENSIPIGFVAAQRVCEGLEVYGLYVVESFRNNGLGKELLRKLVENAKKDSIKYIFGKNLNLSSRRIFAQLKDEFSESEELEVDWNYSYDLSGYEWLNCHIELNRNSQTTK